MHRAHIWAGTYERKHEKASTLQPEVAIDIAREIQRAPKPGTSSVAEVRPVDPGFEGIIEEVRSRAAD